jgi:hypothetical protein
MVLIVDLRKYSGKSYKKIMKRKAVIYLNKYISIYR